MHWLRFVAATILSVATQAAIADDNEPAWRASALAFVPAGYVGGTAYRTEGTTGYLAVYPATSNDPKTPASVFAARQSLVVTLTPDATRAVSAELKSRSEPAPDDDETDFAQLHAELAAKRKTLPEGTEPCALGAWSIDKDPAGLNVRAEPSVKARVLGTLPPPYRLKLGGTENTPEGGWLTEFRIIGFRDGWFLIEGAKPPGKDYEDEKRYPRNAPKPYAGRGWVAANKVGASYANGSARAGGLFQAPFVDAKWTPAQRELGGPVDADGGPKRLLACSGYWGLVESHDGVRGWWRALCSNQVTNCS
ncbi:MULTISPECIES: SH3 domain-containing protein [Bradyrhizobium]|uniref:SH3 domain-containing protein n=1 Tax=Bradyrhizobium TaxID=374 RepID=UPI00293EFE63|nr:SH3 domain-containing protein [Bradyrhizobium sp. NDS-1]WOH76967.1 SH3 domain-containing protein [Bradyrhizobium sp. NDS-1]